jgi:flavin reductase (DIM6/NTAB) family NADH-FMN oxidoreductase RutF
MRSVQCQSIHCWCWCAWTNRLEPMRIFVLGSDSGLMSFLRISAPSPSTTRAEQEAGARFDRTAHGTPVLHGALAYLECRLQSAQDAGDHTIFIAEVEDVVVRNGEPLLFFQGDYHAIGNKIA